MTQPSQTRTSQVLRGNDDAMQGYHPHCGVEHHHKPAKAIVGVGLLVVLSFVLYELKAADVKPASDIGARHQAFANR